MFNFRVLHIASSYEIAKTKNGKCFQDTQEFPDLMNLVEDDTELFIFSVDTNRTWNARDFFFENILDNFSTTNCQFNS